MGMLLSRHFRQNPPVVLPSEADELARLEGEKREAEAKAQAEADELARLEEETKPAQPKRR